MSDMAAQKAKLFGLLGLRALFEHDRAEFERVADLSRKDLDRAIRSLIDETKDEEAPSVLDEIQEIVQGTDNAGQAGYLLRQIQQVSLRKAQQLALLVPPISNSDEYIENSNRDDIRVSQREFPAGLIDGQQEVTRLAVMAILRRLPSYSAKFNFRIDNRELDALIEPDDSSSNLPVVVVETKSRLVDLGRIEQAMLQLKRNMKPFGQHAIGILLSGVVRPNFRLEGQNIFLLRYNIETNALDYEQFSAISTAVLGRESYQRSKRPNI